MVQYFLFKFYVSQGQGLHLHLFNSLSSLSDAWRVLINAFDEEKDALAPRITEGDH